MDLAPNGLQALNTAPMVRKSAAGSVLARTPEGPAAASLLRGDVELLLPAGAERRDRFGPGLAVLVCPPQPGHRVVRVARLGLLHLVSVRHRDVIGIEPDELESDTRSPLSGSRPARARSSPSREGTQSR